MNDTEKILLDANAVLNAALLPQSFAARAVVLAKQLGHCRFLVSAGVMREVKKRLNEMPLDEVHLIPAWAGGREGKFTIAHFPGGFWVYYSAAESCWVAEVEGLKWPLRVPGPVSDSTLQTLCLSWQIVPKKFQIQLRVGGVEHPDIQPLKEPLGFRPSGNPIVGSYAGNRYFWNGHIYFCISNDKSVGNKTWKKYQEHRDPAPNPYDADRLEAAVQALCTVA